MIRLRPLPEVPYKCPQCQKGLEMVDWLMPGMRCLAELKCSQCGKEYYGDLPSGHGACFPVLLDSQTGRACNSPVAPWFADWLEQSFRQRTNQELKFEAEEFRPLKRAVLLNCLDCLYGHSLLKLLNAQHHLEHQPELDLIVLIPAFLRWMVPDGVAAIWTVHLPLSQGTSWNDWLAQELKKRINRLEECFLSMALHPHPLDLKIERFTRVKPFDLATWTETAQLPKVAFIWREDRMWIRRKPKGRKLLRRVGLDIPRLMQTHAVIALAESMRKELPELAFSVIGLGRAGGLPGWMQDMRCERMSSEGERAWCKQYSQSHVIIGIHGSNMLLPSIHAGAVIELMPGDRWGNTMQDILLAPEDYRQALVRVRFLPSESSPKLVADCALSLLRHLPALRLQFASCRDMDGLENPWLLAEQWRRAAQ